MKKQRYRPLPEPSDEYDVDQVSKTKSIGLEISKIMGKIDPEGSNEIKGKRHNMIHQAWVNVAGEQISKETRSVYLKDSTLIVLMRSGIWAHELSALSAEYVERVNCEIGEKVLESINFRVRT
jgi:hypothetical protein